MPNYRLVAPVIRWGATLQNAVYFPFAMDSVFSGSETRAGGEQAQFPSGVEDAWRIGTDYVLLGSHRWLAQSDTLFYPRCTGWDGALGLGGALSWMRDKNSFNWHPDGRNLITAPTFVDSNADGVVDDFGTASGTGVTFAYDGANAAQKITVTGTTPTGFFYVFQEIPSALAGEQLTFSAEYKVSGVTNAVGRLIIQAEDGGGGVLASQSIDNLTATVFTRIALPTLTVPIGIVHLRCYLEMHVTGAAPAGFVEWRFPMVRRDSSDPTFIDNPRIVGCYLVDPVAFTPANETDGSRQLVAKIRNPTVEFAGY